MQKSVHFFGKTKTTLSNCMTHYAVGLMQIDYIFVFLKNTILYYISIIFLFSVVLTN